MTRHTVARFNFAPQPARLVARWILFVTGAALLWAASEREHAVSSQIDQHNDAIAQLQHKLHAAQNAETGKADTSAPLQGILDELNYPWATIWHELEAANGEHVQITRAEQPSTKGELRIEVAASDYSKVDALLGRLQAASGPGVTWVVTGISQNGGMVTAVVVRSLE